MQKFVTITIAIVLSIQFSFAQSLATFINEVHYVSNNPTDKGLEIAGVAGTNLTGWEVAVYAADGTVDYVEYITSGIIPNKQNGYGTIWYEMEQTGNEGGLALINPNGAVVQFLSYGTLNYVGVIITAVDGPAAGMISQYIGSQLNTDNSLQLIGTGITYLDFVWGLPGDITKNGVNKGQLFSLLPLIGAPTTEIPTQNNIAQSFELTTYPNPVTELIQIRFQNELAEAITIGLYDTNGRLIQEQILEEGNISTQINVANHVPGQYVLNVRTATSNNSQLIVKQ